MYVYIHKHIYTHIYVYIYIYTHTYISEQHLTKKRSATPSGVSNLVLAACCMYMGLVRLKWPKLAVKYVHECYLELGFSSLLHLHRFAREMTQKCANLRTQKRPKACGCIRGYAFHMFCMHSCLCVCAYECMLLQKHKTDYTSRRIPYSGCQCGKCTCKWYVVYLYTRKIRTKKTLKTKKIKPHTHT